MLVPAQAHTAELLDAAIDDPRLLPANLRDMARANRWLGADQAVQAHVRAWIRSLPPQYTPRVLDVATGGAALPLALHTWSQRVGRPIEFLASDLSREIVAVARQAVGTQPIRLLRHDALALPFADHTIDVVICSQALHHFDRAAVVRLLQEFSRVARRGVIISDLRRSYASYWGAKLLARIMPSPLSRHDGPLSVLRAYTPAELRTLVQQAAVPAQVRSARGFRIEITLDKTASSAIMAGAG